MELAKESVLWIFRIFVLTIVLVFIIIIPGSFTNSKIEINELESYLIRNKIILDEECLAYNNYRTNLGIIDKNKFNNLRIKNCLNTDKGVRINLTYDKSSELILINDDLATKIHFCYDEETFSCIRKEYNLILKDNTKEIPAKLVIDTIILK